MSKAELIEEIRRLRAELEKLKQQTEPGYLYGSAEPISF
jgi:ribosomal protein L29